MFKIIIAFATIIAIVSAQDNLHPNTRVCFEDIEQTILHAKLILKAVNALNSETLSEIKKVFEEVKLVKNICAGVPFADIQKYSTTTNSIFTEQCIIFVIFFKNAIIAETDMLGNNMSLENVIQSVRVLSLRAKSLLLRCFNDKPQLFEQQF